MFIINEPRLSFFLWHENSWLENLRTGGPPLHVFGVHAEFAFGDTWRANYVQGPRFSALTVGRDSQLFIKRLSLPGRDQQTMASRLASPLLSCVWLRQQLATGLKNIRVIDSECIRCMNFVLLFFFWWKEWIHSETAGHGLLYSPILAVGSDSDQLSICGNSLAIIFIAFWVRGWI